MESQQNNHNGVQEAINLCEPFEKYARIWDQESQKFFAQNSQHIELKLVGSYLFAIRSNEFRCLSSVSVYNTVQHGNENWPRESFFLSCI